MDLNKDLELILNDNTDASTFISSLDSYLNTIETSLTSWLNRFEWNRDDFVADSSAKQLQCPFNKAHLRISENNYEKHIERCRLKSLDFSTLNITDYFSQPIIDSHFKIDPDNIAHETLFTRLNQSQKLTVYDNAIEKSKQIGYPVDSNWSEQTFLADTNDKKSEISSLNINLHFKVNDFRDKKRRPKTYKTSKTKSYTDTIRNLIQTQMDLLQLKAEKEETKRKESADSVSVSREAHRKHQSRSRSRDSRPHRHHHRHHDDRDHLKKKEKR